MRALDLSLAGLLSLAGVTAVPALGQEIDFGASVGVDLRWFPSDPAFPDQFEGVQESLILEGDVRWESEDRSWRAVFVPFARIDGKDDERSHFDVREAYVEWIGDAFEVRAGIGKVFWGVTESRHLVDIVNQTDAVEDIDEEDKLGQPMIEIESQRDWGRVSFFILPGFRERTFPGVEGRLRAPLPVDQDAAVFESSAEEERIDFAGRYSHFIGDWDIGLSVFHGTSREPRLVVNDDVSALIPVYDVITQAGADIQYTREAWLWKLEAIVREGQGETFGAAVAGVEYTFFGINQSGADLGVLVEYQFDDRDPNFAPPTIADNDVFVGTRLAFNDMQDTSILAGGIADVEDGSMSGLVEAERRFGQNWTGAVEAALCVQRR